MRRVAFLFPGQGSQRAGMGQWLWEQHETAKRVFEEANDAAGLDLQRLCSEADAEALGKTENTQPAVLTASVAAYRVAREELGVAPFCLAGHSLGEYSALVCAGAMGLADAVRIVRHRGKVMQAAAASGVGRMAAVGGVDRTLVEAKCRQRSEEGLAVAVACYNSPDQTVVSGHNQAVEDVTSELRGLGATTTALDVSAPCHSPLMQEAAQELAEELGRYSFAAPQRPVFANATARPYGGAAEIPCNLIRQMTEPVRWQETIACLRSQGVAAAVEVGPGRVLRNLLAANTRNVLGFSFDDEADRRTLAEIFPPRGFIGACQAAAVCTRNRNWNEEEYAKGVVEPYRRVRELQDRLEQEDREPTEAEMGLAFEMVRSVFATKKVPVEEQAERLREILEETRTKELFSELLPLP